MFFPEGLKGMVEEVKLAARRSGQEQDARFIRTSGVRPGGKKSPQQDSAAKRNDPEPQKGKPEKASFPVTATGQVCPLLQKVKPHW